MEVSNEKPMSRQHKVMLLKWLKNGTINIDEFKTLKEEIIPEEGREMSMEEARAFIKRLEEIY